MGHIFVSYSHKDTTYAHGLADHLRNMGFDIWMDERLDYGSQWPLEIQKQLDACDTFILIMTPRSFASDWVQSELQRAKRKLKPIFPLLLEGDEPWLSVESTQYYDVRGEKFPDERFYSAIKRIVSGSQNIQTLNRLPKAAPKTENKNPQLKMKMEVLIAIIGGVATVMAACAAMVGPLVGMIPREPSPIEPSIQPSVDAEVTETQPLTTSTVFVSSPVTTATITPTLTFVPPTATFHPTLTPIPSATPISPIPQEEYVDSSTAEQDMHVCPVGFAIAGVRIDRNQFLCRRVMRYGEEKFVATVLDSGTALTARADMHTCPLGMYMRGLRVDRNDLLCSYDGRNNPPSDWQAEFLNEVEDPGSVGFDMHICPAPTGSITYLTGIRVDQNRFLCATHKP